MGSQPRRSNRSKKIASSPAEAEESLSSLPAAAPLITIRARNAANKPFEPIVVARSKVNGHQMVIMARNWGYILRVRTRWAGDPDMREYFGGRAIGDLDKLGITRRAIQRLALATHIEIELCEWDDEDKLTKAEVETEQAKAEAGAILEAASEIPWEYLLSTATKSVGRFQSVLISRCFSRRSKLKPSLAAELAPVAATAIQPMAPQHFLFVESAPGRIEQVYGFGDEEKRLQAATKLEEIAEHTDLEKATGLLFSKTEPYSELKRKVEARAWDAIHVTGVDTHQVAWLVEDFYDAAIKVARRKNVIDTSDRLHDGMILRGDRDSELPVRYDELASLLVGRPPSSATARAAASRASKPPPCVVTLNLYYSGARTARELVRRGVYAAIGFLDEIDDEFAERFFQAFYWAWCHKNMTIPDSFLDAWSAMDAERMHGTAIVIWLGRSAFDSTATPR
ncbi:MAG TPA: hypothetical protein VFQ87_07365 [Bradyrhizobium sp.]|jgi:hypothetical protein|nr:hypothetical protein [Bradyrhizobium sp.]